MKVLDYKNWKKRNLLVLKMLTASDLLENSLSLLGIPYILYDCVEETNLEKRWETDKDLVCGIIISGSRVVPEYHMLPSFPEHIIENLPVLGICYGHEILGSILGSKIVDSPNGGEKTSVIVSLKSDPIFQSLDTDLKWQVTMRHDQMLQTLPPGSKLIASTSDCPVAGFHHEDKNWWGLQFHPEKDWMGNIVFKNFYSICRS